LNYPDERIAKFPNHHNRGMTGYQKAAVKNDAESILADFKPEKIQEL